MYVPWSVAAWAGSGALLPAPLSFGPPNFAETWRWGQRIWAFFQDLQAGTWTTRITVRPREIVGAIIICCRESSAHSKPCLGTYFHRYLSTQQIPLDQLWSTKKRWMLKRICAFFLSFTIDRFCINSEEATQPLFAHDFLPWSWALCCPSTFGRHQGHLASHPQKCTEEARPKHGQS